MQTELLKALGLDEDTELATALDGIELDEDASKKLLEAATDLRAKADKPPEATEPAKDPEPVKTLEQQATESGKRLLDAAEFRQLEADAKAGAAASLLLFEQRFDHAFEAALKHEDGAKVTPAEEETLHKLYALDADTTLKLMEDRPAAVPAKPAGAPAIDLTKLDGADAETIARAGLHPGSHNVDRKVKDKLKELDKPQTEYSNVLKQMMEAGEL
jgi:hypothetical protein